MTHFESNHLKKKAKLGHLMDKMSACLLPTVLTSSLALHACITLKIFQLQQLIKYNPVVLS